MFRQTTRGSAEVRVVNFLERCGLPIPGTLTSQGARARKLLLEIAQKLMPSWAPKTVALVNWPVPPGRMMYWKSG
jgi:hypothetical protein